ncbi:hypothetical protein KIPB_009935, partial [Kipferlia bialata]
ILAASNRIVHQPLRG